MSDTFFRGVETLRVVHHSYLLLFGGLPRRVFAGGDSNGSASDPKTAQVMRNAYRWHSGRANLSPARYEVDLGQPISGF